MNMRLFRKEGGFTSPAAALAILVACSLVFACTRMTTIESRSGQIQYVADAGAIAADGAVAQFVTLGQVVDAAALSFSLTALTVYAVSAVASFIPGAQGTAAELAGAGAKIFQARDRFMESATKGLNVAQKALPAICAARAAQVIHENAEASGMPYAGVAITSPVDGIEVQLADGSRAREVAEEIEEKEERIQEESVRQQDAQKRENEAKERAWRADCGNNGMSMYERAGKLSNISGTRNPYYSSVERWSFSVALNRAKAYYSARYNAEPGANASGSPELVGESVARKQFYAYALEQVSQGYIEMSSSGSEMPHLKELARNTSQIKQTSLYTNAIYPVSNHEGTSFLHAYRGCPKYADGTAAGSASVRSIDSGAVQRCPTCKFSATTLGRVPSASTSINNGFEYHYRAVVEASRDYAQAAEEAEEARRFLSKEQSTIGKLLSEAVKSLASQRYDPQPPGRYGCICIVAAPSSRTKSIPFVERNATLPARVAISGASLAPDAASDQSNVIKSVGEGLIPQEQIGSSLAKKLFGTWGNLLTAYGNGTEGIKAGLRKTLGIIPVVGNPISEKAVKVFEDALSSAGLQPANLNTYKPVLVNTAHILNRDTSRAAQIMARIKQASEQKGAFDSGNLSDLQKDLFDTAQMKDLLNERGLTIASIPLSEIGLGNGSGSFHLPVPENIDARLEDAWSSLISTLGD